MVKNKFHYYSLKNIQRKDATYNVIFGERSNGKTYAVLKLALENFKKDGSQFAYVRRWQDDIKTRRASTVFNALQDDGTIAKLFNGEYTGVTFYSGKFYLCTYDDKGKAIYSDSDVLGYAFALSETEHGKSNSYPKVTLIMFDEFLTKHLYLPDEFVLFMNTISTIVRLRTNVKIYMLGNTVNKFCPYFQEMGLNHIREMKQGSIDVYSYGDSKLKVAVEYTANTASNKKNNFYFAFNNPKLAMITGGAWELNIYPHVPIKFKPRDIKFIYFIVFNDQTFQCEIVDKDDYYFTYIHLKTTPIKDTDRDLIYTTDYVPKINYKRDIKFIYFIVFNDQTFQCEVVDKDDYYFTYIHLKTTPIKDTDKDLIYTTDYVPKINYNRNILKPINELQKNRYQVYLFYCL